MTKNESTVDRVVRVLIAIVAAVAAFAVGAGSIAGVVLLLVAVIMLVTAAVGFCPIYRMLGLRTTSAGSDAGLRR